MISNTVVSIDLDWAPDWCIKLVRDLCIRYSVQPTIYATHESAVVRELANDNRFEVGIHPNFLPGSSHGSSIESVIEYCLDLIPQARTMRTHALFESTLLFRTIADQYPQIESDSSVFLPFLENIQPINYHVGFKGAGIIRIPFFWEDDIMAEWPGWSWMSEPPQTSGLRVFDFHPVYLALNIEKMDQYRSLKKYLGSRRLYDATKEDFEPFINKKVGNLDFFKTLIESNQDKVFSTISAVLEKFKEGQ